MELITAENLRARLYNCKTGTTVFCHTPGNAFSYSIRQVLGSPWNHTAVVFWINGELFIVEGMIGDVIRPKRFDEWLDYRKDNLFGVSECEVPDKNITRFFGLKPTRYDLASVFVWMLIFRATGKWYGRVNDKASSVMFCFEFSALVRGLPNWWRIVPSEFPI